MVEDNEKKVLEKLIKEAIEARTMKKYWEDKYNELRDKIHNTMVNEMYINEYITNDGVKVRETTTKRKTLDKQKVEELVARAREAGIDVKMDDLYSTKKFTKFEILTPEDQERRKKFSKKKG